MHFKKYGELNSLEGKSNDTGIRFKDNYLVWNGLKIPVRIDYDNPYEYRAMQDDICYCRIKLKICAWQVQILLANCIENKYLR